MKILAERIKDFLNEALENDRAAIAALVTNRVPCTELLANHPEIIVASQHGGFHVGLLGILNGICTSTDKDSPRIAAELEDGNLIRFVTIYK